MLFYLVDGSIYQELLKKWERHYSCPNNKSKDLTNPVLKSTKKYQVALKIQVDYALSALDLI